MAKITVGEVVMEGTIEELREWAELTGVEFPGKEEQPQPAYRKIDKADAKAGDFVKFGEDDLLNDTTAGKYYAITLVDNDGDFEFLDDENDENVAICEREYFEVYTLRQPEEEPAVEPLKVGDYAKLKTNKGPLAGFKAGGIVKNKRGHSSPFDFEVNPVTPAMASFGYTNASNLEKVSAEEIAKIEAEAKAELERKAESEKWAKIGRKPGEFKKGDIVRYVGDASAKGSIVEVYEDTAGDSTVISWSPRNSRSTERGKSLELITPVEARFDQA